jgi:hypothetical protein
MAVFGYSEEIVGAIPTPIQSNFPRGFFENPISVKQLFQSMGEQLGIKDLSGWYRVSTKDLQAIGAYPSTQSRMITQKI